MTIEIAKGKELEKKLELTGYAISSLSLLVNEILFNFENSNAINCEFPTHLSKELVVNSNSSIVNDFFVKNGYLIEKEDCFVITEKTLKIFETVLNS